MFKEMSQVPGVLFFSRVLVQEKRLTPPPFLLLLLASGAIGDSSIGGL